MLLGLLLANHAQRPDGTELADWTELDQLAATIPAPLLAQGRYKSTTFFTTGQCSSYPNVAHYFACGLKNKSNPQPPTMEDMYHRSCLNGWGFGNLGISAGVRCSVLNAKLHFRMALASHACWLEDSMRVTNSNRFESPLSYQ
jgi:hypothetical protein